MGPSTTNTEDGTASFIVQTDDDAQLCVEARSNGQTATARWKLATD